MPVRYQDFHFTKRCDYSTDHPGGIQSVMGDGSVRLADASDSFVFDGNSQPIGEQVTFTATISNLAGLDGVFVASGDVDEAQNNLHQLGLAVIQYDGGPSPLESDYSGAHALYQDVMIV
jgi:hypothetical protein